MNSRLLGLAALVLIAFVIFFAWRRASGTPDLARVEAARLAARPHFAALERCLLGEALRPGEKPAQRLRNVVLANETLVAEADWPGRCASFAQQAFDALRPVRAEDPRVDRLVASFYSVHLALSQDRAPAGIDTIWANAARFRLSGGAARDDVRPARAPLRPLSGVLAATAVLGPRLQRVADAEDGTFLLAGPTRLCHADGARVSCSDGEAPQGSASLVVRAPTRGTSRAADLVIARREGAPTRVLDAETWAEITSQERLFASYSQRGGALVLRGESRTPRSPTSRILVESIPPNPAASAAFVYPSTLVVTPSVVAGFVYYAYADLRAPASTARDAAATVARLGLAWLPDDAGAPVPQPVEVRLPSFPAQVLACVRDSGRAIAFINVPPTEGDLEPPRAVEVHFYDARGSATGVVRGALPGSAAVMSCIGDDVALLARKQVAVNARRGLQLAALRCSAAGCQGSIATFARMNDVPDAITLADGRALVVYRTAASGGLRARIAPPAEVATAREYVLADDAAYGGVESGRRFLMRDALGALLVLETRHGVIALRIAGDGTLTLLR